MSNFANVQTVNAYAVDEHGKPTSNSNPPATAPQQQPIHANYGQNFFEQRNYVQPPVYGSHPNQASSSTANVLVGGYSYDQRAEILRKDYNFAPGVSNQFNISCDTLGPRFWIVDNSGSMAESDGHVIIQSAAGVEGMVSCSRWEELGQSICWHAELAAKLRAPTEFRLLNPPGMRQAQIVHVGYGDMDAEMNNIRGTMGSGPTGRTPLCQHIKQVYSSIVAQAETLRANGRKALLVIATDGASSDGDVAACLRPFRDLPVWIVIRLCTDDDAVVSYWNGIDEELELDMDVLDDVCGEAAEVTAVNPWLTYGVNLHKLREWGATAKEFDLLDERAFKPNEIKAFITLVFGDCELPHPELDYPKFFAAIEAAQSKLPLVWDPLRQRNRPWIDIPKLRKAYVGGCSIM